MKVDNKKLEGYLDERKFVEFFVDGLGYDEMQGQVLTVEVDRRKYSLRPIAKADRCVIYACYCNIDMNFPQTPVLIDIVEQV